MAIKSAQDVITVCSDLRNYWMPRDRKFRDWYQMIESVDLLKTEKMESFVGNDPRAMFNLILHLLDQPIPHRVRDVGKMDFGAAKAAAELGDMLGLFWRKNQRRFRKSGPFQTEQRQFIAYLLATGWYARFACVYDNGQEFWAEPWNPAEVFPMWYHNGLSECAHIFTLPSKAVSSLLQNNGWSTTGRITSSQPVYDYWYLMEPTDFPFRPIVWNAVVIGTTLVKNEPTHFKKIPIYVSPVGGLPDTGALSRGARLSTSPETGTITGGERWKEEIGQAVIATNEHIYRTWNKWWTYGLQLLRDTAQPRIFERSQKGKTIVKPEDVFRRGAIFRGGPNDSVEFLQNPVIPLELRQNQIDLEAMMQRGGVSWSLYGDVKVKMTTYMMAQIAASANQVMKPFHQAIVNCAEDVDEDVIDDMQTRGVRPYGFAIPDGLPAEIEINASYEIKIPGEIIQKATVSRMLNPDFRLSNKKVLADLWPDIADPLQHQAEVRADEAMRHPANAQIALIKNWRNQARFLRETVKDTESAELFDAAADSLAAQIKGETGGIATPPETAPQGTRPEAAPPPMQATATPREPRGTR